MEYALIFAAVFLGAIFLWWIMDYVLDYLADVVTYVVRRRQRRKKRRSQTPIIFDMQDKEKYK